jgi:hypothetical protein
MIYQICNTGQFLAMAINAKRKGYNRQIDPTKLVKQIDPDGTHVCKFSMLHEHIAGRKVPTHIRSIRLVKLANKPEPAELALDIDLDVFNRLQIHDTEDLKKANKE